MRAQRGDHIVVAGTHVGEAVRDGEIIEVRGPDGGPPYRVRWGDGREGIIYPGASAEVRAQHGAEAPSGVPADAQGRLVREWDIRVSIYAFGDDTTTAKVAVVAGEAPGMSAAGESRRSIRDRAVPRIGDKVAVARALHHLADELLADAAEDVEDSTGEHDVTISPR
ncbi:DUF1918 domain-containing protein [Georgenia thermotolerans]|uniref:DUF1918 domain-containing protein n=1 Tax=Georgenia thermotolerans TaxID=527326 RepID=A0A7J5US04_9MICO|nr:DUF1918 domain-containing protein [Georgenia thermotolerans]KAE8765030.1 DUF1918 domain-containing protein [Georgenia thermotolerans]